MAIFPSLFVVWYGIRIQDRSLVSNSELWRQTVWRIFYLIDNLVVKNVFFCRATLTSVWLSGSTKTSVMPGILNLSVVIIFFLLCKWIYWKFSPQISNFCWRELSWGMLRSHPLERVGQFGSYSCSRIIFTIVKRYLTWTDFKKGTVAWDVSLPVRPLQNDNWDVKNIFVWLKISRDTSPVVLNEVSYLWSFERMLRVFFSLNAKVSDFSIKI
jgi:hypothetical protein